MSTIYFRSLKYNTTLSCSFHVMDGTEYVHTSECRVGDTVHLMFHLSDMQARDIQNLERPEIRPHKTGVDNERWGIFMHFRVSERRHTFSWRETGILQTLGSDIFLQAEDGYWEDVFRWACLGEVPEWADVEEEASDA